MRRAAVGGVLLFWLAVLTAGALAPGYSIRDDYVSSLAGRGSAVAVLGIAALAVLGLAHLAGARAVRASLAVAVPLAVAGVAGLAVAAFRTGCPGGAAGCGFGTNDAPADLADVVHVGAVVAYEVALVAAMAAVVAARGRPAWFRALTAVAAVASVVLLLQVGGVANGLWQRAWLLVTTGWLVALVARAGPAA
jgi:hypothetical protein